jgi:two-component system, OmpR family, response regulator
MKVLVAEDDLTMRYLMGKIMVREELTCSMVGDGVSALEAWDREHHDCILMDVQMPRLDGLSATQIIRQRERERGGHTVIIAVTAFTTDSDRQRCLDSGMDDYISKPIDVNVLLAMMRRHSVH